MIFWDGYCPESWLKKREKVAMRLNYNDFFESEATGLQVALYQGIFAVVLTSRGQAIFRPTPTYAHELVAGEPLVLQNKHTAIFSDGKIFLDENYPFNF